MNQTHKKHIVWIIPGFAANEADDTCIPMMLDFLKHIQQNEKVTISIIPLHYPFTSVKYQIYQTTVFPANGRNKWFRKLSVWKKSLKTLGEINSQQPITLIHSFWLGDCALIGQAFSLQHKIPHICTIMGQDVLSNNRHLNNKRLKDLTVIGLSSFHAELFYKNSGRRVDSIIPFGMVNSLSGQSTKKYDIIGVGSLIPIKNYIMWIEIIDIVARRMPNIKAVLVGEGSERKELENLVREKKLESIIQFAGRKQRSETLQLIDESHLFLHTSKHEGQGYIFVEAMSSKLPILSTPVGHAVENDKIWKGNSVDSFAEKIIEILNKAEKKVEYDFPLASETYQGYKKYYECL